MRNAPAPKSLAKQFISSLRTLKKEGRIESSAELARMIGVPEPTVRSWFAGRLPSTDSIRIAQDGLHAALVRCNRLSAAIENALLGEC